MKIDGLALYQLTRANKGRKGFTYTHYPINTHYNVQCVEAANQEGFTINVSCDSLRECDKIQDITDAPLVVVLRSDETRTAFRTDGGQKVVVCPTYYIPDTACDTCQLCYQSRNRAIIGFPAHGSKKKTINIKLEGSHEARLGFT